MAKKEGQFIVWPAYLDSSKTRSMGRMISKEKAVDSPTPEEILEACRDLSYVAQLEVEKKFPSSWWERPGRVLVSKKGDEKKVDLLVRISASIAKRRSLKRK
ncbi:MAG: signal recognition particle subunit SRP19/SEC65 family protein [Candidatus Methanosuratincola sp.]